MNEKETKMNKTKRTKEGSQKQIIFTKETLGVVLILFATLCLVFLITGDALMFPVGGIVQGFLLGCFGYFAYAVMLYVVAKGVLLVVGKKIGYPFKLKLLVTLFFISLATLGQVVSMRAYFVQGLSYGQYIAKAYVVAQNGYELCTVGGFFTALISYGFSILLTNIGSYVVLGITTALSLYGVIVMFKGERANRIADGNFKSSVIKKNSNPSELAGIEISGEREYPIQGVTDGDVKPPQNLFVINASSSDFKPRRKNDESQVKIAFTKSGLGVSSVDASYTKSYTQEMQSKLDYIKTPAKLDLNQTLNSNYASQSSTTVSDYIPNDNKNNGTQDSEQAQSIANVDIPLYEHGLDSDSVASRAMEFSRDYLTDTPETDEQTAIANTEEVVRPAPEILSDSFKSTSYSSQTEPMVETQQPVEQVPFINDSKSDFEININRSEGRSFDIFAGDSLNNSYKEDSFTEQTSDEPNNLEDKPFIEDNFGKTEDIEGTPFMQEEPQEVKPSNILRDRRSRGILFGDSDKTQEDTAYTSRVQADKNDNFSGQAPLSSRRNLDVTPPQEPVKKEKVQPPINRVYNKPPIDLLKRYTPPADAPQEDHEGRMQIIKETLEDFHIFSEGENFIQGPTITRYEFSIPTGRGVSVKKVLNYDDDLKMRLACQDGVRIEAPIAGKNMFGIEVANRTKVTVGLREVMEGMPASDKPKTSALNFAIGKDIVGSPIYDNLAKGPHYLVAGATGSGKSVCLNTMLVSLIMRYSPEELKLILVDPKGVEFAVYEHIPHLMIDEIITHPKKAIAVLSWAYQEMERRFQVFRDCAQFVVDIDAYNSLVASNTVPRMPRIVIVIDELADLMQTCKKDLEARIGAIAQKARSAGIHLVLATQRPSVDVITGTIKANLPSRIAFKVTNFNDSQTILAEAGAEKLLGNGDMLYKNAVMPNLGRYQGAFITAQEVSCVCEYIKEKNVGYFDDELQEFLDKAVKPPQEETNADADGGSVGGGVLACALDGYYCW